MKFSNQLSLFPDEKGTGAGGQTQRVTIIKGLAERGHKVTLLTPIVKTSLERWDDFVAGIDGDVWYDPVAELIPDDVDVVYVENGSKNMRYTTSTFGEIPSIIRCTRMLSYSDVPVLWQACDYDLYPEFIVELTTQGVLSRWLPMFPGSYKLLTDAVWFGLGKAHDLDKLVDMCSGARMRYPELKGIEWRHVDYGMLVLDDEEYFNRRPKNRMVYVGNQKSRIRVFRELLGDLDPPSTVYGYWPRPPCEADYRGRIPYEQCQQVLRDSMATVYISGDWYIKEGSLTSRFYQATDAGCVTLIDANILTKSKVFTDFDRNKLAQVAVYTKEDVQDALDALSADVVYRSKCLRTIRESMDWHSPEVALDQIESAAKEALAATPSNKIRDSYVAMLERYTKNGPDRPIPLAMGRWEWWKKFRVEHLDDTFTWKHKRRPR